MPSIGVRPRVAVDSSALVALFDGSDRHHERAKRYFDSVRGGLVTNVAVLTEVSHLLTFSEGAVTDCLGWVASAFSIDRDTSDDLARVIAIMGKYADLPADFADATLVAMCERLDVDRVATFDRDFSIYRLASGRALVNAIEVA